MSAIKRIRRSVAKRGAFATLVHGIRALPTTFSPARVAPEALRFDRERGIDTAQPVELSNLKIESRNAIYGVQYQPVSTTLFRHALSAVDVQSEDYTFVDLGCGKGKALILALEFGFRRLVGVEFAQSLLNAAKENLGVFLACASIQNVSWQLACADAAEYDFPFGPLVIFMYNPFEAPVMSKVAARILKSFYAERRPVYVVYINPTCPEAFDAFSRSETDDFHIYSLHP